jgi:hypothetical protein
MSVEDFENLKIRRARDEIRARQKQHPAVGNINGITLEFEWWYRIVRPWVSFLSHDVIQKAVEKGARVVVYTSTDIGVMSHPF